MHPSIPILKKSGEEDFFDDRKLVRSLTNAGAGKEDIETIVREIRHDLRPGMHTSDIYRKAYRLLRTLSHKAAGRYRLKEAIFELGPTGYPFEKFVGALLAYQGYRVETGVLIQGACVQHEVDVVARKNNETIMAECKFHSDPGRKSDVKVPLYIDSRFRDIRKRLGRNSDPSKKTNTFRGWLVTNTRFTEDAVTYGKCAGMTLISWDYPQNGSLKQRIDLAGLFPVTCLNTLSRNEKKKLLDRDIVLCREIMAKPVLLEESIPEPARRKRVLSEINAIFA